MSLSVRPSVCLSVRLSVCLSVFKVCPDDISETSGRIDFIFHTRINHNLKVCLVVVLFDSAKKCQNDRTLKHLLDLFVCTILSRGYLRDQWSDRFDISYTH